MKSKRQHDERTYSWKIFFGVPLVLVAGCRSTGVTASVRSTLKTVLRTKRGGEKFQMENEFD